MHAFTADQMRALDAHGIDALGIPGIVLMENAGRQAAALLAEALGTARGGRVAVVCGPGNNGGDGAVIARHLTNWGFLPEILLTRPPGDLRGDARTNLDIAVRMGIPARSLDRERPLEEQLQGTAGAVAVVDAIFGTGLTRELDPWHRGLVAALNALDTYRFAVDLPSGVHPDTGAILGEAFRAHRTATFGGVKLGLVQHPGRRLAGEVFLVDISLSREQVAGTPGVALLADPGDPPRPPRRPEDGHKNRFGHVLVVAGSPGKGGAALLAGMAALRSGAGLCTVATRGGARSGLLAGVPDLMIESLDMDNRPEAEVEQFVAGKSAVAIGPGLGTCAEVRTLVTWLVDACPLPRVLDADALGVYAGEGRALRAGGDRTVLTPHPGELARLLAVDKADIAADRLGATRRAAAETGCVTILKGASTVVAAPDGRAAICLAGNAAMAKAGSGDVLTGVIGALLGQLSPWDAACLGVWAHARAGDHQARNPGPYGLLASDLLAGLGPALREAAEAPAIAWPAGAPRAVGPRPIP
jgi:hydroxyethylthiazole kinase-like uncharacterized protein yjeF